MDVMRAVFVCAVLCSACWAVKGADATTDRQTGQGLAVQQQDAPKGLSSHRVQLFFPLLLRISTRLATLVPTAIMAVFGIFLFVAFSKKAFLISLLALFLTYLDKYRRSEEDDMLHIHKVNWYDKDEVLAHNEEHLHYGFPTWSYPSSYRKVYYGRYPPSRYWPTFRFKYPIAAWPQPQQWTGPPAALEGLRRRASSSWSPLSRPSNETSSADFQKFLSESSGTVRLV